MSLDLLRKFLRSWLSLSAPIAVAMDAAQSDFDVHLLCCRKDVPMATAGLMSFCKAWTGAPFGLHIHSDGSLEPSDIAFLQKRFTGARVHSNVDPSIREAMTAILPVAARVRYSLKSVLLQKILDPYCLASSRPILILDSDILWFQCPQLMVEHLERGCPHPLVTRGNGDSPFEFGDHPGFPPECSRVNSGVVLYRRPQLDRNILESFLESADLDRRLNAHFVEQTAYALALRDFQFLPYEQYTIDLPKEAHTVCRHYTGPRRDEWLKENLQFLLTLPFRRPARRGMGTETAPIPI
ncbi:hypothetical protein [Verrucomicrobium spinosum]|uniref:hypothetical protein n=1 Tax=Verrucomicrobium spinosum TaxID=2736 RepID=UPI0001746306|nr:hypothetical protein [Verrucomicrobium spinosum]